VTETSHQVLRRHARSFSLAGEFLPRRHLDRAATVYHFCRWVDDLADETPDPVDAAESLQHVLDMLNGDAPPNELVRETLIALDAAAPGREAAIDLVKTMQFDLNPARLADDAALLRYCYGAAGTVGVMMCAVLEVEDRSAWPHAVDLGIGMQLTNICRDVLEDSEMGRVYLPETRLRTAGTSQAAVLSGNRPPEVRSVTKDLLDMAEVYYASGLAGIRAIPGTSRYGISAAAHLYRGIGRRLSRHNCDPFLGRTVVPWYEKALLLLSAIKPTPRAPHEPSLHLHLQGLPGTAKDSLA